MTEAQIKLLADLRSGAVRLVPTEATPEMVAAALKVDWSNEDEEGTAHNVWHVTTAASPDPASLAEMIEGLVGERDEAREERDSMREHVDDVLTWLKDRELYDPRDYEVEGPDLADILTNHETEICGQADTERAKRLASDSRVSELQAENEKLRGRVAALMAEMQSAATAEGRWQHCAQSAAVIAKSHSHHALWVGLPMDNLDAFGIALAQRIETAIRANTARALAKDHPNGQG